MVSIVDMCRYSSDSNAIRVDSVSHQQVGHIIAKNGHARVLARIVDGKLQGGAGAQLEGTVVSGAKNVYAAHAEVRIVGLAQHRQLIRSQLDSIRVPYEDLATGECKWGFNLKRTSSSSSSSSASSAAAPANYQQLSDAQILQNLNGIWDEIEADNSALSIDVDRHDGLAPANFLSTLFPHQRQGVAWMLRRETEAALPPLFSEVRRGGSAKYHHALTEHDYETRPPPVRGGALCDDMGLGE